MKYKNRSIRASTPFIRQHHSPHFTLSTINNIVLIRNPHPAMLSTKILSTSTFASSPRFLSQLSPRIQRQSISSAVMANSRVGRISEFLDCRLHWCIDCRIDTDLLIENPAILYVQTCDMILRKNEDKA